MHCSSEEEATSAARVEADARSSSANRWRLIACWPMDGPMRRKKLSCGRTMV